MALTRLLPKTIRGEFALFAVSLALPLFGLIGYGLYDRARDEFAAAEALARRLAESSADRAAQYVADLRSTLEAVAQRPLVRAMDRERCDPRLADLVDLYPRAGSFIIVNNEGDILCSSRPLPRDRVLRIVDEKLLGEMLADPRFRISKPVVSVVSKRWVVSAVHPVFSEGGAAVGSVAMANDLLQWRPFPTSEGLPDGATITIITSDGTIIARTPDTEKWVGRRVWDERIMQRMLDLKEGVVRAKGADDVYRIFGFKPVAGQPWFVLAGLPEESVFAPARERLAQTGALLALVVGIVLALAWGFVARLSNPILAIAEAVRARTEGNEDAHVPVAGPVEVAGVVRELNRLIAIQRRQVDEDRRMKAEVETANRQLRDSEERLNFALQKSHIGGWDLDLVDHTAHRTLEHDRIFGYGSLLPQWTYEMFLEHVLPEDRAEVDRRFREATAAQTEWSFECRIRRVDGEVRWILATGEHQRDEAGQMRRMAGIVQDITERKSAEQALLEAHARLEQRVRERTAELAAATLRAQAADRLKSEFLANMSHELRTPLNGIIGFSEFLVDEKPGKLNPKQKDYLNDILNSGRHLLELINDVLDLSRVEAGRMDFSPETFRVQKAIDEVCTVVNPLAWKKGIRVKSRTESGLDTVTLDPQRFKQVLYNLLSNAVKFTNDNGAVQITAAPVDGGRFQLSVKDNGIGIRQEDMKRLFLEFEQIDSGAGRRFEGTGLGLALTRKIVELQGGSISVESELGKGSTFTAILPLGAEKALDIST